MSLESTAAPKPGGTEKVALCILKRLASEVGMRCRGKDGHRKRPSLDEVEAELMRHVKRGRSAFDHDANGQSGSSTLSPPGLPPDGFEARFLPAQLKNAPKHTTKFPDGVPQLCGVAVNDPKDVPKWVVIGHRTSCPTNSVLCVSHKEARSAREDSAHVIPNGAYACKAMDAVMSGAGMSLDCLRKYRVSRLGAGHGLSVADMTTPVQVKVFFGVRECVVYDIKKLGKAPIVVQECGVHKTMHHVDSTCFRRTAEAR